MELNYLEIEALNELISYLIPMKTQLLCDCNHCIEMWGVLYFRKCSFEIQLFHTAGYEEITLRLVAGSETCFLEMVRFQGTVYPKFQIFYYYFS